MAQNIEKTVVNVAFDTKAMHEESDADGAFGYFSGYASTFGNVDSTGDIIEPGAFKSTITSRPSVKLLWQHDMFSPIGKIMSMEEDGTGLYVKGRINLGVEAGKSAYALLKAGDLDQMSIGYIVRDAEENSKGQKGCYRRKIKALDLHEISLVSFPANEMARVMSVKSVDAAENIKDIEEIFRERGFSRKEARSLVSKIKEFSVQCDAESESPPQPESQCDAVDIKAVNVLFNRIIALTQKLEATNGR